MISISRRIFGVPVTEKWFAQTISTIDHFSPCIYTQCSDNSWHAGFSRSEFATKIVDISVTENNLFALLDKGTQYEIRRAKRDGVRSEPCANWAEFISFYNVFASLNGRSPLTWSDLLQLARHAQLFHAVYGGDVLVMHMYLLDFSLKRCRLLYSASHFRDKDNNEVRALMGRANRHLHWNAMLHFKSLGFVTYDMGGYAINPTTEALVGINKFKDGLGGILVMESHYISWLLIILRFFRRLLNGKL